MGDEAMNAQQEKAASKWCKENTFGKSEVSPCTEYNCDYPYTAFLAGVAWQRKQKVVKK